MPPWVWPSACFLIQPQIGRMLEQVGGSASVFRIGVTDLLEGRTVTRPSPPKLAGTCSGDGVRRESMTGDSHLLTSLLLSPLPRHPVWLYSRSHATATSQYQTVWRRGARLDFGGSTRVRLCAAPQGWWLAIVPFQLGFFCHYDP